MFPNFKMSRIRSVMAAAIVFCSATSVGATTYTISFDGAVIDLSGTIETTAIGTFGSTAFDALVTDFSITASANGTGSFVFTAANSSWGGAFTPGLGGNVSVLVTASTIQLLAAAGTTAGAGNLFLIADVATGGARPNLILTQTGLRYFTPVGSTILDTVSSSPFVLATAPDVSAVPVPAALPLFGAGLAVMGFIGWRRKRKLA